MIDRGDGPWDEATEHDDQRDVDADLSGEDPPTTRASDGQRAKARGAAIADSLANVNPNAAAKPTTLPPPPIQRLPAKPLTAPGEDVVMLDRVSGNMPVENAPRPSESAAGGVVVVATGSDAERVRKLCHKHSLLVPVMTSLGVVHDAMSIVVIGEPSPPTPERVVHVVRPTLADDKLLDLLRALVSGHVVVEPAQAPAANQQVAEAARRLTSLTDRAAIESTAVEATKVLTGADRAHCLFHDPVSGGLWSEARRRTSSDDRAAMGGLVGWAAQTGQAIHASPAGDDPRWLQELDDPDGKPQSRLLVQPIIGGDRRVHGVLVAIRRWSHTGFTDADLTALAAFAALAGPALDLAVTASPPEPRKRTTLPRAAASASALAAPATLAAPRTASDSRPPPVLASTPKPSESRALPAIQNESRALPATQNESRALPATPSPRQASNATAPGPMTGRVPAVGIVPIVDDQPKVDERYSSESITSLPSPPSAPAPRVIDPVAGGASPPATVPPRNKRASTNPAVDKRTGPVRARSHADSNQPKFRREGEPRDLAVVANEDDAKRVQRLAKRLRLELSTFPKVSDAPDYYQVVTLGETWSGNDDRVAYAARSTISDDQLCDLLTALANDRAVAPSPPLTKPLSAAEARRSQLAFAGARKLAANTDLAAAEANAIETVRELLDTDRAYLWLVEPDTGALWSESRKRATGDARRAIAGIAGWVARTGRAANVPRASADPRWLGPIDDPEGDPHSQLLVQPIVRADQRVYGVLIAARRARRPGFTETDTALLARFAALAAPLLEQIAIAHATQEMIGEDTAARAPLPSAPDSTFTAILRGLHPAARWLFLALGLIVGLVLGLLL